MPGARRGDENPLDICVISSHVINKSEVLLERMGRPEHPVQVGGPYGKSHARTVILSSIEDYEEAFGE